MRIWTRLLNNQRGATAIEYALVASMISVAGVVAFENLGNSVDNRYIALEQALDAAL